MIIQVIVSGVLPELIIPLKTLEDTVKVTFFYLPYIFVSDYTIYFQSLVTVLGLFIIVPMLLDIKNEPVPFPAIVLLTLFFIAPILLFSFIWWPDYFWLLGLILSVLFFILLLATTRSGKEGLSVKQEAPFAIQSEKTTTKKTKTRSKTLSEKLQEKFDSIDKLIKKESFSEAEAELQDIIKRTSNITLESKRNHIKEQANKKIIRINELQEEKKQEQQERKKEELKDRFDDVQKLISKKRFDEAIDLTESLIAEAEEHSLVSLVAFLKTQLDQIRELDKVNNILDMSEEIKIDYLAEALSLERKDLINKFADWNKRNIFEFKIVGDIIRVESRNMDAFILELDKSFEEWENSDEKK